MSASPDPRQKVEFDTRRRGARRTALVIGGIALAIYVAFLVSGALLR